MASIVQLKCIGTVRYLFEFYLKYKFLTAKRKCTARGGKVAVPKNQAEEDDYITVTGGNAYLLGLVGKKVGDVKTWRNLNDNSLITWSNWASNGAGTWGNANKADGTQAPFAATGPGQPQNKWGDIVTSIDEIPRFICEKKPQYNSELPVC